MFLLFGRFAASVLPETDNSQFSPSASTLSPSLPGAPSSGMFSDLHSSLAPPKPPRTFSESPRSSMENLSVVDSLKKRRAPQRPGYPVGSSMTENYNLDNGAQVHNSSQMPLPLPDYETLFSKKRHGVMGQMRWDHVIAEVSQRNWDHSEEMNVDGPEQQSVSYKPAVLKDRTSVSLNQQQKNHGASQPANLMHKEPLIPPKSASAASPKPQADVQYRRHLPQETEKAREKPTPAGRSLNSKADRDSIAEDLPAVKPRQRSVIKDPVGQVQPDKQVASHPVALERIKHNGASTKNGAAQRESFHFEALDEADHSKVPKEGTFVVDPFPSDAISANKKTTDPFPKTSAAKTENKNQSPSFTEQARATFQKNFSLRKKNSRQYPTTTKALTEKSGLDRSVSQSSQDADDVELTVTSVGLLEASDPSLGGLSGGQTTVRGWVSPSEPQPVTLQNGSGSAVSNSRR